MDDYRQQQIDILKEAVPYSEKLIGAVEKVNSSHEGRVCLEEDGWILLWINLHRSSMRRK
mgnify:CR=1 FL=1